MKECEKVKRAALTWWDSLDESQQIEIEKRLGYYGHDIGTTEEDILYFYKDHESLKIS